MAVLIGQVARDEPFFDGLDLIGVSTNVEDLAKAERNAARSQMRRIVERCLKLEHSPAAEPRLGWKMSIDDARNGLAARRTPMIRRDLETVLPQLFAQARRVAAKALLAAGERQAADALPPGNPYRLGDLLADDWYPPSRHGLTDAA